MSLKQNQSVSEYIIRTIVFGLLISLGPVLFFGIIKSHASSKSWVTNNYSKVRIIGKHEKTTVPEGRYIVGLHLIMKKGWKTYWRVPGDSGIPPHFDWSKSKNVKNVEILWPAPKRLKDPYGVSIGYKTEILFPAVIEPIDPSKPIVVDVKFQYGVCDDICVPEKANLTYTLDKNLIVSPRDKDILKKYVSMVPQPFVFAKGQPVDRLARPTVHNISAVLEGKQPHIMIEASFPENAEYKDMFVEASDNFYMDWAKLVRTDPNGKRIYRVDLTKGDKAEKLRGKKLTLTLVSNKAQSEVSWVVQ